MNKNTLYEKALSKVEQEYKELKSQADLPKSPMFSIGCLGDHLWSSKSLLKGFIKRFNMDIAKRIGNENTDDLNARFDQVLNGIKNELPKSRLKNTK